MILWNNFSNFKLGHYHRVCATGWFMQHPVLPAWM